MSRAVMIIPFDRISPEALLRLLEEFVTRDGTDYGERETPLDVRVAQVLLQLHRGTAMIVYDEEGACCTILPADQVQASD